MSTLEQHAREIRRAVAALRAHADAGIGPDDIAANAETRRAARAAYALEDAIMRTLPVIGMDPAIPSDDGTTVRDIARASDTSRGDPVFGGEVGRMWEPDDEPEGDGYYPGRDRERFGQE